MALLALPKEEGRQTQLWKVGDVIVTHDGVKHWHGAKRDSWFEQIAINAGKPEWLEPGDEETLSRL